MQLERMLRIYSMQQWFTLSDPQAEGGPYDMESMRRLAGIELRTLLLTNDDPALSAPARKASADRVTLPRGSFAARSEAAAA